MRTINQFQLMACVLTQGFPVDCKDSQGGAQFVHLIEKANITAITLTANKVTAMTKATGKKFFKYVTPRETAYGKSLLNVNAQNGTRYYAQEVMIALNKMQTNTKVELETLAAANVLAVVTDQNGRHWLYGYQNGLDASGGESGTGAAPSDRNGYTITLSGNEPLDAIEVDDTTFAALETAGT